MSQFSSKQEVLDYIEFLQMKGREVPQSAKDALAEFEAEERIDDNELIFSTMAAHNPFMSEEKERVVREMTEQLMCDEENASQPCLLLGKVQCGKTDTFLSIMGLCFDKGIDIAIVMTKGTRTLADQTIKRLKREFRFFEDRNTYGQKTKITVYDILDLYRRGGLSNFQLNDPSQKFIIVAKKEATNLEYLTELFANDEAMRRKKVLVCDDEADFASRAYYQRKGQMDLYRIGELIETLIKQPSYCRYLQITATPYSLYLQPDGTVQLRSGEEASPWLPRYTGLVPIHDRYIGGKQYYIDSQEGDYDENGVFQPANIYGYLYQEVSPECRAILSSPRDDFYIKSNIHSEKLDPINYAVVSYLFATAVRSLQQKRKYENASAEEKKKIKKYTSSCLIHNDIEKAKHEIQAEFITTIIENIKTVLLDETVNDLHLLDLEGDAYESLRQSNELGNRQGIIHEHMPSFMEVENEVKHMLQFNDYKINVVNSDNAIEKDDKGQLKLEHTMNFFIGGSILDRGITIDNMLCFFYGRNPGKTQMDTALQHARMYGSRDKEDMACTRFFTTADIYDILYTINRFDDYIYEYLKANRGTVQTDDFTRVLIGYDKRITPSAQAKYTPANTKVIKAHQRNYPVGFQTFEDAKVAPIIKKIDACIEQAQLEHKPNENGFFLISYDNVATILKMITDTYTYGEEWHNVDRKWDPYEMLIPLHHLTFNTDGYVWMKIVKDRELSREREDIYTTKGRFVDAPESGSEVKADRSQAEDRPVIVLVGQKGAEEKGWRNTPFYWPTLTFPKDMQSGMFTLDGNKKFRAPKKPIKLDSLGNYPKEEVLKLTISRDDLFGIISGNQKEVSRNMKRTIASMFLAKDLFDNYILVEGTDPEKQYSLASYNDGVFPYEIRQYKYIHFRASMDMSGSQAIVKIEEENPYEMIAKQFEDFDVHYDANNQTTEVVDESKCFWRIVFYLGDVLETKFAGDDKDVYEAYLNNLRNS